MVLTLDKAKSYLRVTWDDEDDDITDLIVAAELYLTNAGITIDADNELAILAIKMMVVHWYNHREPIGETKQIAWGLSSIITQLQNA